MRNKLKTSSQSQLINNKHIAQHAGQHSALDQYGEVSHGSNYATVLREHNSATGHVNNNLQNTRSHSSIIAKQQLKNYAGAVANTGQTSSRLKKQSAHSSKLSLIPAQHQKFDKSSSQPNIQQ